MAESDMDFVKQAKASVAAALVASCECGTKTPEATYHDPSCRYVKLDAALDALDLLSIALARRGAEGEHEHRLVTAAKEAAELARKGAEVEQKWPEGFSKIDWPMLDCCATEGCGFAPTIRMERGDVASFYCEPCARKIARLVPLAAGERE